MATGTIKKVVADRGFGFIAADDAKEYFFHRGGLDSTLDFDRLVGGEKVEFDVTQSPKGPRAERVRAAGGSGKWPAEGRSAFHFRRPSSADLAACVARPGLGDRSLDIVRTAYVSTYPPRQCGIAAFTGDLSRVTPDREIVALHPLEPVAAYAFEVHHKIRRDERDDYPRTARSLERCADVAAIQFAEHIWGGADGEAVLDFVGPLKLPTVVTLHTLAPDPSPRQREILMELVGSVAAVVVMSDAAAEVLTNTYGVDPRLVEVIPYGVPDLPMTTADVSKASVGLADRDVILSFGLLGPGKGYEMVIDALPEIVKSRPNVTYVIVGATHPDVRLREGEAYRTSLTKRAAALKVANHVRFVPEFVGRVELARWLQSADVFVSPRQDLGTLVSGTLAQAMAAGRAIVATEYAYATELLADGRGVVVPPTPHDLAAAIVRLLGDEPARRAMGALAHEHTRPMVWTRIGTVYQELFTRVASGAPLIARGKGTPVRH